MCCGACTAAGRTPRSSGRRGRGTTRQRPLAVFEDVERAALIEGDAVILKFRIVAANVPVVEDFEGTFVNLWRDVPAEETLKMTVPVQAPSRPGAYRVDVVLLQLHGNRFATAATDLEVEASPL